VSRLARKLEDSAGVQGKLVKIRTAQNNFLMHQMNVLRRYALGPCMNHTTIKPSRHDSTGGG
jgi:hypothetical protein